jgi:hypothetical protein
MILRAPLGVRHPALSLTTIASELAPTEVPDSKTGSLLQRF